MVYLEVANSIKAFGKTTFSRNQIIKKTDLIKSVNSARKNGNDLYRSVYSYDEDIIEHMKTNKTVSGFKGRYYVDNIVLDVDRGEDTDAGTLRRAVEVYESLTEDWKLKLENFSIWFSGTGYHFSIPDIFHFSPSNYLPFEIKDTIAKYFPGCDTMPYMPTGLIRVGYTKNLKSGLYKIRLEEDDLYDNPEIIKALAEVGAPKQFGKIIPCLLNYHDKIVKNIKAIEQEMQRDESTMIVTCVQNIFNRGAVTGQRHQDMIALAMSFRKAGIPRKGIISMLDGWSGDMPLYEVKKIVNDVFDKGYVPSCKNRILAKYCDPKCIHYKNKNLSVDLKSAEQQEKDFISLVRQDVGHKTFDLNNIIPIGHPHILMPEDVILFFGDTGLNKTAFAQNIAVKCKHLKVLYLTLEFSANLLYRRNIQIDNNMTKDQVVEYYQTNNNGLSQGVNHIHVIDTSPDIVTLQQTMAQYEPNLVIIDTVGDITMNGYKDTNGQSDDLAKAIKKLAMHFKCIIIEVHHVSKSAILGQNGASKRLNAHSGKGASALEQKADEVWTIEGKQDELSRIIKSQKVRDKEPFSVYLKVNPETFIFSQYFGE